MLSLVAYIFWRLGRGDTLGFISTLGKKRKLSPRDVEVGEVEKSDEERGAEISKSLQLWSPVELPDNQMPWQELDSRRVIFSRGEGTEVVYEAHSDFVPA